MRQGSEKSDTTLATDMNHLLVATNSHHKRFIQCVVLSGSINFGAHILIAVAAASEDGVNNSDDVDDYDVTMITMMTMMMTMITSTIKTIMMMTVCCMK